MAELSDQFLPASAALGPEVELLLEQLALLHSFKERAAQVCAFFSARLKVPSPDQRQDDRLLNALYYAPQDTRLVDFGEETGLSLRQMERRVKGSTGLAPKQFRRIARLHHVMRQLLLEQNPQYLDTALAHGYYDQSHFVHDVKELTGRTPLQLLTRESFMSHFYNTRIPR